MPYSPARDHLQALLRHGPRPIGTPANQQAADYLRDTFTALGLAVEEQAYPCTVWDHTETILEWEGERLACTANAFSLPCDVLAPIVTAGTLPELEAASARAKVLLLHGDLIRAPIAPKSWFLAEKRDHRLAALLEEKQPAAVLAPPAETLYLSQLTEDWGLDVPAATLPPEAALRLLRNPAAPVRLRIDCRREPGTARNIVARTPPGHAKRVVLCAHFDTKINTPGAFDNGGGVACLLVLAESLRGAVLPFDLEFVAFNGEEYLPMGDDEYLRRGEGYFGDILAAVNMDGVGPALGSTSVTCMSAPEDMQARLQRAAGDFPGVAWVEPWPESNHSTFAFRGVPAVALSSVGCHALAHRPQDDLEHIDPARLDEVVRLVGVMLHTLAA